LVFWLGAACVALEARAQQGGIALVFDASAQGLPEAEVRAAVERELGRPLAASSEGSSGEITVLVDQGRIVVRYRSQTGASERYLPMPSEPSDIPLLVSLAAGNLARDPVSGLDPAPSNDASKNVASEAPPVTPAEKTPKPAPSAPPKSRFRKHRLGFHVAQDIPYVSVLAPCANDGSRPEVSCFYAESSEDPFFHDTMPGHEQIEGFSFGTTRLLFSYDYFPIPRVSVGTRVGYALGGGPPSGQKPADEVPEGNLNLLPLGADGTGGSPFLPVHAELRGAFWFLRPDERLIGAYVGAGFGLAQVDSKHYVEVVDCAATLSPNWDPADGTFDDCNRTGNVPDSALDTTELDAWEKMGRGFVTATAGATLALASEFSVLLNVNTMFMFPDDGFVLEPSLGGMLAF
jgi:hypothetical protein